MLKDLFYFWFTLTNFLPLSCHIWPIHYSFYWQKDPLHYKCIWKDLQFSFLIFSFSNQLPLSPHPTRPSWPVFKSQESSSPWLETCWFQSTMDSAGRQSWNHIQSTQKSFFCHKLGLMCSKLLISRFLSFSTESI